MPRVRAITADDLAPLAQLGLNKTVALRAIAQDMGWLLAEGETILGAATACLADGTVFLDSLVGLPQAQRALIDHALSYARWSFAPALTLVSSSHDSALAQRGFVGLETAGLPPALARASAGNKVLMKRL